MFFLFQEVQQAKHLLVFLHQQLYIYLVLLERNNFFKFCFCFIYNCNVIK